MGECQSVAQALQHDGEGDATGAEVVPHLQERAMPNPHPPQATQAPQVSVPASLAHNRPHTAQIERVRTRLLGACRSVAQALEHEGKGDATGTEVVAHPQKRTMPKPHPRHVSAPSERASIACAQQALHGRIPFPFRLPIEAALSLQYLCQCPRCGLCCIFHLLRRPLYALCAVPVHRAGTRAFSRSDLHM